MNPQLVLSAAIPTTVAELSDDDLRTHVVKHPALKLSKSINRVQSRRVSEITNLSLKVGFPVLKHRLKNRKTKKNQSLDFKTHKT